MESLSGERDVLTEKVVKYKGQVVSLSQDLEQYRDNQDKLEKRLKQEIKVKEEVTVTLGKREDKLKKKERQLEEEMTAREKLAKEVGNSSNSFQHILIILDRYLRWSLGDLCPSYVLSI